MHHIQLILKFDRSNRTFYKKNAKIIKRFRSFRQKFGSFTVATIRNENIFVISKFLGQFKKKLNHTGSIKNLGL